MVDRGRNARPLISLFLVGHLPQQLACPDLGAYPDLDGVLDQPTYGVLGLPRFAKGIPRASAALRSRPAFFKASILSGP